MTAPDMESFIAKVIVAHWVETIASEGDGFYVECRCGEIGHVESDAEDWEPANQWLATHQARAVLAAISGAGAVEWGIRYGDGDIDGGYLHKSEALTDIARLRERVQLGDSPADGNEPMTLLKRRRFDHAGPWTAVEG